jgi:CheY-like chemotaxis protein
MAHILIVDDDWPTIKVIELKVHAELPEVKLDSAACIADARTLIKRTYAQNLPYDIAILDFCLPETEEQDARIDESLCREVRNSSPDALIIHITSYGDHAAVLNHAEQQHMQSYHPDERLIQKGLGWEDLLLRRLRTRIHGRRIEDKMDELFDLKQPVRGRAPYRAGLTHRVAELGRDIAIYWDDLDGELRNKVLRSFDVEPKEGDGYWVSLKRLAQG